MSKKSYSQGIGNPFVIFCQRKMIYRWNNAFFLTLLYGPAGECACRLMVSTLVSKRIFACVEGIYNRGLRTSTKGLWSYIAFFRHIEAELLLWASALFVLLDEGAMLSDRSFRSLSRNKGWSIKNGSFFFIFHNLRQTDALECCRLGHATCLKRKYMRCR